MSFKLAKTTSLTFLLSSLTNTEKAILERMKIEVEGYLQNEPSRDFLKCLASSFNESLRLGLEESVPVLKNFFSFIRHRLIDGNPQEFKRLLVLLDHYLRSCGFRAQVLIGRKKFLETIYDTAKRYSKIPLASSQECSYRALQYLEIWSDAFHEYHDDFPYYAEIYQKARSGIRVTYDFSRSGSDSEDEERPKIQIDFTAIAKKYPALTFN